MKTIGKLVILLSFIVGMACLQISIETDNDRAGIISLVLMGFGMLNGFMLFYNGVKAEEL